MPKAARAINNIQRSASLFLVKTVYASLLSIAFLFITAPYPFEPIHLTLIGFTTTGVPSVVLGLQPNHDRVQGHFLKNVLTTAAPCGITIALAVLMAVVCGQAFSLDQKQVEALCVLLTLAWRNSDPPVLCLPPLDAGARRAVRLHDVPIFPGVLRFQYLLLH